MADEDEEKITDLDELDWVRQQLREAIPDLGGRERISALAEYRKLIGQIAALKKALNAGSGGASGKLERLVGDAPSGGTEGEWEDPEEYRRAVESFVEDMHGGTDD